MRKTPIKVSTTANTIKLKEEGKIPKVKIPIVLVAKSSAGLRLGINFIKQKILFPIQYLKLILLMILNILLQHLLLPY